MLLRLSGFDERLLQESAREMLLRACASSLIIVSSPSRGANPKSTSVLFYKPALLGNHLTFESKVRLVGEAVLVESVWLARSTIRTVDLVTKADT